MDLFIPFSLLFLVQLVQILNKSTRVIHRLNVLIKLWIIHLSHLHLLFELIDPLIHFKVVLTLVLYLLNLLLFLLMSKVIQSLFVNFLSFNYLLSGNISQNIIQTFFITRNNFDIFFVTLADFCLFVTKIDRHYNLMFLFKW